MKSNNSTVKSSTPFLIVMMLLLVAASISRLVPHPANFTPLLAMALVGGYFLKKGPAAYLMVLGAIVLSDAIIGFHSLVPVVYGSLLLMVAFSQKFKMANKVSTFAASGFLGSVFFFLTTNFAVWAQGVIYPKTMEGLWMCYVAALPFFQNTLASTLLYSAVMVAAVSYLSKKIPALNNLDSSRLA